MMAEDSFWAAFWVVYTVVAVMILRYAWTRLG